MNQPWIYMCSPSQSAPASLCIPSHYVFLVHQPWALVSCIQPGLVICFTLDSILKTYFLINPTLFILKSFNCTFWQWFIRKILPFLNLFRLLLWRKPVSLLRTLIKDTDKEFIWTLSLVSGTELLTSEVARSCPTLCDLMDCSLPGSSIHEIFQVKSTGAGCHFLLQGVFPTQGSNPGLPHGRQMLYRLNEGSPQTQNF